MPSDRRATPVRAAHRAEFLLTRAVQSGLSLAPERVAEAFGGIVGRLVQWPLGIRTPVVRQNLRRAFPDADPAWLDALVTATYRHLGREAAATMRLHRLGPAGVVARTEMVGWESLLEALAEGRGAILAAGHLGNWEVGAAALAARGLPTSGVVQRQSNRLVDERLDRNRRVLGVDTIPRGEARTRVPRALRSGRVVGMVADQDAGRSGIFVPFFGQPASTHRGPALFALRIGAPIFVAAALRVADAPRYRVHLERLEPVRTGDLAADVAALTERVSRRLEELIRISPEQYFWFHKRWKTAPPTELASQASGTTPAESPDAHPEDGPP
jgi:Kdo2-lipid IVA lauroyltransferase/acyltransferase